MYVLQYLFVFAHRLATRDKPFFRLSVMRNQMESPFFYGHLLYSSFPTPLYSVHVSRRSDIKIEICHVLVGVLTRTRQVVYALITFVSFFLILLTN